MASKMFFDITTDNTDYKFEALTHHRLIVSKVWEGVFEQTNDNTNIDLGKYFVNLVLEHIRYSVEATLYD